jgi:predicted hydrocarbon binding protein
MPSAKNTLASIFIKNFIIPRAQVLDQPGFILFKMGGKSKIYSRQLIFPESFLVDLESELVKRYGDDAKKTLYVAGKKFGVVFASMGNFFTIKSYSDNQKFIEYVGLLNNFIEGTYAQKMSFDADMQTPKFNFHLDKFVGCNKSGLGYFLPNGAAAGLLCYLLERDDIEGVQTQCQGRGEKECLVTYAPQKFFQENKIQFIDSGKYDKVLVSPEYANWNKVQSTKYSKDSFQNLLNSKFFSYNQGVIEKDSQRYFIFETSGIYILETELKLVSGFDEVLLQVSTKQGETLWEIGAKNSKGLSDLLTAFGWGDIFIVKKSEKYLVNIDFYPWTPLFDKTNFTIIQGILQGALSKIEGRKVEFKNKKKNFNTGALSVSFYEEPSLS